MKQIDSINRGKISSKPRQIKYVRTTDGFVVRRSPKPLVDISKECSAGGLSKSGVKTHDLGHLGRVLAKTAGLADKLEASESDAKSIESKSSFFRRIRLGMSPKAIVINLALAMFIVASGYVVVDTWLLNLSTKSVLAKDSAQYDEEPVTGEHRQSQEGKDQTPVSDKTIEDYAVAPGQPRLVAIDRVGAKGRLLSMGVNRDGSMQAPINVNDGGWYNNSAKPGEPGAVVINGHSAENRSGQGLFGRLHELENNDIINIQTGDSKNWQYRVVEKEYLAKDEVDMRKAILPHGNSTRGLNIITCDGGWTKDNKTMEHRIIIYALPVD